MKKLFCLLGMFSILAFANAQVVENGEIVFEVKTNMKKTLGTSPWAEMMKDKLPNFKTAYYSYSFNKNKSMYRFDHWENKESSSDMMMKSDEKSVWYTDFEKENLIMQKDVFGTSFNIKDSVIKIEWKLSNENRIIAGYNCRKAVGKILDSVYVFAFYTDEITLPGGPCTINGLPGMILGVTIPRLYTSWIATKINTNKLSADIIEPASSKNIFKRSNIAATIDEKTKDWSDGDDPDSRKWIEQLIWNVML